MDDPADTPDHLALLDLQIAALFAHDARGRILHTNEPPPHGRAPRFFLGRTTHGNRWRFRDDLLLATVRELDALARAEPIASDLRQPLRNLEQLKAVLALHATTTGGDGGPAYRFPARLPLPSGVTMIDHTNIRLLREWEPDLPRFERHLDVMLPCAVVVENDVAVSVCFCSRLTPRAAEAGLETLPRARGCGYAVAVVAAWARAVRATGRTPLYSTSWDNLASQSVAQRLGLILYAEDINFP
jgi:hypothetical protein